MKLLHTVFLLAAASTRHASAKNLRLRDDTLESFQSDKPAVGEEMAALKMIESVKKLLNGDDISTKVMESARRKLDDHDNGWYHWDYALLIKFLCHVLADDFDELPAECKSSSANPTERPSDLPTYTPTMSKSGKSNTSSAKSGKGISNAKAKKSGANIAKADKGDGGNTHSKAAKLGKSSSKGMTSSPTDGVGFGGSSGGQWQLRPALDGMTFDGYNAYGDTEEICASLLAGECRTVPPGWYQIWAAAVPKTCPGGNYDLSILQTFCKTYDSDSTKITFGHGLIETVNIGSNRAVCYDVRNPDTGEMVRMFQVDNGSPGSPEMGFRSFMYLFGDQQPSACNTEPSWPSIGACQGNRVAFEWKEVDCGISTGTGTDDNVNGPDDLDPQLENSSGDTWEQSFAGDFTTYCPNLDQSLSSKDCPTRDSIFPYQDYRCDAGSNEDFKKYTWTTEKQTCYLHGDYGLQTSCVGDSTRNDIAIPLMEKYKPKVGYMVALAIDGEAVNAVIGTGHGVKNARCGECFALRFKDKYAVILTTGVNSWSLEISNEVNYYIGQKNGPIAQVPDVIMLDSETCASIPDYAVAP